MISLGLSGKVAVALGAALLLLGGASAWYFHYSQNKLEQRATQIAKLEGTNAALQTSLDSLASQYAQQISRLDNLNREVANIRKATGELGQLLSEHDLRYLALKKPGLIEKRVNEGTKRLFEEFTTLSDPSTYEGGE